MTDVVRVGPLDRRYLLTVPPGGGAGRPVVVFLHGTGGTAEWADAETGWSAAAAEQEFVLAVPEALPPDVRKPPKFLTNPPRWNDGSTRDGDTLHTNADDVGFLRAVVVDVLARTGGDRRRVYLSGFSNGAGMAFRFAAEAAEVVAAVAPVAGHCWTPATPARPVPTLYVVGTADPLIPLRGGPVRQPWGGKLATRPAVRATLEVWAGKIGCGADSVVASEAGGVREEVFPGGVEFRAVFVAGLGHHWPGGQGRLDRRFGGEPAGPLDANGVIGEFFRRHTL